LKNAHQTAGRINEKARLEQAQVVPRDRGWRQIFMTLSRTANSREAKTPPIEFKQDTSGPPVEAVFFAVDRPQFKDLKRGDVRNFIDNAENRVYDSQSKLYFLNFRHRDVPALPINYAFCGSQFCCDHEHYY